jgi:hypothetical protein
MARGNLIGIDSWQQSLCAAAFFVGIGNLQGFVGMLILSCKVQINKSLGGSKLS